MSVFSRKVDVLWNGDIMNGNGEAKAGTGAFSLPVTFPSRIGEPAGKTSPEELLAASHAACYAMALQRYVIIVATAFGGAWTALVGGLSMLGNRAAQVTDGWVLYPLRVPQGHEWMWVGWIVLGGIGAAVQLSNRPRTAKR